jgi:excisionase family DNA binding protein
MGESARRDLRNSAWRAQMKPDERADPRAVTRSMRRPEARVIPEAVGDALRQSVARGYDAVDAMTIELSPPRLLRADEVARLLNIGKSTVYLLCREQKIPHVMIGHSVRFPEDALRRWLQAQLSLPSDK